MDKNKKQQDSAKFNKDFDIQKDIKQKQNQIKSQQKIDELEKQDNEEHEKMLHEKSVLEIGRSTKDVWLSILDDIITFNFSLDMFTKEYRLFYIGLTIVVISLCIYLYNVIIYGKDV